MTTKNVFELPERSVREWGVFKKKLVAGFLDAGQDEDAALHACEMVRPLFLDLWKPENFDITVRHGDGVKTVDWHIQKIVTPLLFQVALLALENHNLRQELEGLRSR